MTYEEFLKFVQTECTYETIYSDSDGRNILVIKLLDAYGMVNKAQRKWIGLTEEDRFEIAEKFGLADVAWLDLMQAIEAKLKEKNT
jgi:hypothetical protein